jgi:predicted CXXCH cytochrome family protein
MTSLRWCAIALSVLALGACTNERLVFVNRQFNPPPDSVNGFLGYFDASTQQTSCGNCHVEHQGEWKSTKHAQAWADLMALAQPADKSGCVGCHTVSENGNLAPAPAGYGKVADAAYQDVQCESCHGPGFDHASVPDAGNGPLASIHVDTTENPATASAVGSCAACHQDTHHPFWEEWRQSIHSNMGRHNDEVYCQQCHSGQGALKAWGVTASYKEVNAVNEGITCSVCHDPHGSANPAQLRWPLSTLDRDQQLCMKCHNRRTTPQILDSLASPIVQTGSNSPHAPQGSVVVGDVGYQNPSYLDPAVTQASTHGNLTKNPLLCAGCHLYAFADTGDAGQVVNRTGHLFRPIPCYGPDGLATDSIKNCAYRSAARSFKACTASGCHATEDNVAGLLSVARGRIQALTATLWVNSNAASSGIDTLDAGILPMILKNTWGQRGTLNNLSLQTKGAPQVGDTIINLGATAVTGKLAVTNTFKITGDTTTYTVQATVTAATNQLNGVVIRPALVKAPAANTAVYVVFMGPLLAGDRVVTAADGAEFNVRTVGEDANGVFITTSQSGADRSHTVHNPFLAEALLRANIQELTDLYGSQPWFPVISAKVRGILGGPLGASGSVPFPRPAGRRVASR